MRAIFVMTLLLLAVLVHCQERDKRLRRINLERSEFQASKYDERGTFDLHPHFILFVFGGLAIGTLARILMGGLHVPIPYAVLMLTVGSLLAVVGRYNGNIVDFLRVLDIPPRFFLNVIIPVLVFKTAFCIDAHAFLRAWLQITIISIPGLLINGAFIGLLSMILIQTEWTYAAAILFGMICTPIYPLMIVNLLREIGQQKQIIVLLEGESIVGVASVLIVFEILLGYIDLYIIEWYQFVFVILRLLGGGFVFGFVIGKVTCAVISKLFNDGVNVLSTTLVASFMTYYIAEFWLSVSGAVSIVILGVMISTERASLPIDVEVFLTNFWSLLAFVINTPIFIKFGILTTQLLMKDSSIEDFALVLVTYTLAIFGRFLAFILLAPILSRIGYGITFRQMTVCVWGGLHGIFSLCLALIIEFHPLLHKIGRELVIHTTGIVGLTLLINGTSMQFVLKILGLSELSMARKVNMNNCVKYVLSRRERTIGIMKMDRFLADANWPMVNEVTVLKHPYKINIDENEDEDDYYLGYRTTLCPDCKKEVPTDPTPKELMEMTKEARSRILKAKKISYGRQYENGMLSKEAVRILYQAVEIAMDTEDVLIDLEGLHRMFEREGFVHHARKKLLQLFFKKHGTDFKPPRKYLRRIAYRIIMHPAFDHCINVAILLNVIPIAIELSSKNLTPGQERWLKAANTFFFLIYLLEFWLKICGYSWIYICKHGFRTYFSSYWNIFDFMVLLAAFADFILDILDLSTGFRKSSSTASKVILVSRLIRIVRVVRLIRLCKGFYSKLLKWYDSKINTQMAFAYDIGKGFVAGEVEVSDMLVQMIDNKAIREDMRLRMEADRLAVTRHLGMIQKDRPWIAITVKTKQAIRATINSMLDAVNELKVSGWVDDVEYTKLLGSLDERLKFIRSIKSVQPNPPKVIFQEVAWMAGDEAIIDFLYEHVHTKIFDPGDVIFTEGQLADGIYIVVTGLFKTTYNPSAEVLERLNDFGELPVIDYISSAWFDEKVEDYIVSGNSMGELAILTMRPYCSTVVADTPSQAYVLSKEVIFQAMQKSCDSTNGLEARMWKFISIRLAAALLMDVPAYQSTMNEKVKFDLEAAFMPTLTMFKVFAVNDLIEDIILIEGVAVDFNTRDLYTAPVYIPRTVQKLILPKSSSINFVTNTETKLLIIPTRDAEDYEIMEKGEEMSEMISITSSRCLRHVIQKRQLKQRKRKRRTMFSVNAAARPTVSSYLSSQSTYTTSRVFEIRPTLDESELQNISIDTINKDQKLVQASSVKTKQSQEAIRHLISQIATMKHDDSRKEQEAQEQKQANKNKKDSDISADTSEVVMQITHSSENSELM